ncbi:YciI family protein [Roseivirga pacifica]|uniref:YciI family protein n=1 Tax=Roseivirga pacifica TaxID=1267423 RepID=UPI002095E980|nr:YciI family protein [Roseivirga pacifica]
MKRTVFLILLFASVSLSAQTERGRYTFVFLNTNPDRAELPKNQVDSLQAGHIANINRLVKEQKMIAAGPYYTGGGIFIFDTDLEETQAVLDSDPAIAAGRFRLEVYPFDMQDGEICTLWHKDEADITMTTYHFVRYETDFDHDGAPAAKTNRFTQTLIDNVKYKEKGVNVLGVLNFTENRGQVVIYASDKEEGNENLFLAHELVGKGVMKMTHKKLYFPDGIFCEN